MQNQVHLLIDFLHANPHWGWFLAFFIAFIESLAVIGTIIPGSITLTAIGALVGARIIPATPTILAAVIGAVIGDYLSYWVGSRYKEKLCNIWPFTKYPHWLESGEKFFTRHGGKSILIGRFVGPVRSLIPLVAGILNMSRSRFIIAAIPSASLWAIIYMLPGILLGALALELPPKIAVQFVIVCLIAIVLAWFVAWLIRHFFKQIWQVIDKISARTWNYFENHKYLHWINSLLRDHHYPELHGQLTLLFFAIIFGLLFIITLYNVATHGVFTHFNQPLHHLLMSIRNHPLDNIMIAFTLLGYRTVLLTMAGLISLWLVWKKHWRTALHLLGITVVSAGAIELIKHLTTSPRPGGLLNNPSGYSFPSGHTVLTLSIFGFLAAIIARDLKFERRWIPYFIIGCLTLLVALSRIYLGAHWLTDVVGSMFLALILVLVVTIIYRRKPIPDIPAAKFIIVVLFSLLIPWLSYSYVNFQQTRIDYTPFWPTQIISLKEWWNQDAADNFPLYRTNRLGKPIQALNVQWYGKLPEIKKSLLNEGWLDHPPGLNLRGALHQLSNNKSADHLPLLPMQYLNKSPVLLLTKKANNDPHDDTDAVLVLWASNIQISDTEQPLWVGSLEYYSAKKREHQDKYNFFSAIDFLPKHLHSFQQKKITLMLLPLNMEDLNWDGEIVLVKRSGNSNNPNSE